MGMPESTWTEELRLSQKEERDLLIKLDIVRHKIVTIQRAIDEEMGSGQLASSSGMPTLNDKVVREATHELLSWYAKQGKTEVSAEDIFNALAKFRVLTSDKRPIMETKSAWEVFCGTLGTNRNLFHVKRTDSAQIRKWDKVSLVPFPQRKTL
jgi:hypothetical protein